jgi:hypothetical protein
MPASTSELGPKRSSTSPPYAPCRRKDYIKPTASIRAHRSRALYVLRPSGRQRVTRYTRGLDTFPLVPIGECVGVSRGHQRTFATSKEQRSMVWLSIPRR